MMRSGRRLHLRGAFDEVEVHRKWDVSRTRSDDVVPVRAGDLHRALHEDDSVARRVLVDLYCDLTGSSLCRPPTSDDLFHIQGVLERAFDRGELVALRTTARRVELGSHGKIQPKPPAKKPEPPRAAPKTLVRKTWISIQLVDDQKEPMSGITFELAKDGNIVARGRLDEEGSAYVDGVKDGQYELRFPDIDGSEWS